MTAVITLKHVSRTIRSIFISLPTILGGLEKYYRRKQLGAEEACTDEKA
jgi:hypothetical protein